ncbi:MAG: type 1 glutamine amidotransferase [Prevotella sp.]|jgi:GMP synthase-like glutamine amidotransferase|nr:type 1 glutamine amidotransferase [Prevotella sp.]
MMNKSARRIHYIQHAPFEGPGYIGIWAREKGYELSVTEMYGDYKFPGTDEFDLLVIMGGPMGTYEEDKYPWLKDEKNFVKKVIDAGKTALGICLGSQIIANVLGAEVYPNKEKEIGWLPVTFTDHTAQKLFDGREKSPVVFQWHGDTFDLPDEAILLASSEACVNQAFLYREKALGLQFHFEITEKSYAEMLDNGLDELTDGKYIQTEEYIRKNTQYIPECNRMMRAILDRLVERS